MKRRPSIGYYLLLGGILLIGAAVLVFIVWRIQLARDVNHELNAIHAAGLPVNGEELDKYYAKVPDDQNAALVMEQAFALMRNYPDGRSNEVDHIEFRTTDLPLTPEEHELMVGYFIMNSNALAKAEEAVKLPASRYPIDFSWGAATLLGHLAHLREFGLLERFRARSDLDTNRLVDSSLAIISILGLADTLNDEPDLIAKLVRMTLQSMAVESLERRLNASEPSSNELTNLYTEFLKAEKTNQLPQAFVAERAAWSPYFRGSLAELTRLSDGDERPPLPGTQPLILRFSGFFERDLRFYLAGIRTNIALANMPPPKTLLVSNVQAELEQESKANYYVMSAMMLPGLGGVFNRDATTLAQIRAAQIALQIESFRFQHGQLPKTLGDLVPQFIPALPTDPFDGQPMRYHTLTNGYVIYSVGRDLHDNGGRERPPDAKSSDKTEYDITFTVHR
jgi:hypothetical protein